MSEIPAAYQVVYSKGRKTVGLTVKNGAVTVRAPKNIAKAVLADMVEKKRPWIERKLQEDRDSFVANRRYIEYEQYLFLGRPYADLAEIYLFAKGKVLPQKKNVPAYARRVYSELAGEIFHLRVRELSRLTQLPYRSIRLINARSKWGSYDVNGELCLNWRLVLLPPDVIDYVILHELCHTLHMDHSRQFWAAVSDFMPEYKRAKAVLKVQNFIINLFR